MSYVRTATRIPAVVLRDAVEDKKQLSRVDRYELTKPTALQDDPKLTRVFFKLSLQTESTHGLYDQSMDEIDTLVSLTDDQLALEDEFQITFRPQEVRGEPPCGLVELPQIVAKVTQPLQTEFGRARHGIKHISSCGDRMHFGCSEA